MQIKGIKRGNVIELLEEVGIPDDTEILIEVRETSPTIDEERWEKMNKSVGAKHSGVNRSKNPLRLMSECFAQPSRLALSIFEFFTTPARIAIAKNPLLPHSCLIFDKSFPKTDIAILNWLRTIKK